MTHFRRPISSVVSTMYKRVSISKNTTLRLHSSGLQHRQFRFNFMSTRILQILIYSLLNQQETSTVLASYLQCESKKSPLGDLTFFHFFHKRLSICKRFFTHLWNILIFATLQVFIQLPIL